MKEKWNGSLHFHWVFGPHLLIFKESFTPSHPHTHLSCPLMHIPIFHTHWTTYLPPSHYILSSFYTSITHFPHYFPITPSPPIYHSFLTRLAPFLTCMTSKAHGHLLSLYILIPITLHITIPITLKMPHQLPHYSFLTHACMVVLTSLTPTVFYPFIKFTHYPSNHHLPMPTNPLLPLPINCIPFLREPFVHLWWWPLPSFGLREVEI